MEECNESEQVSDHFTCAVCLDILYKPIVLVCGHVTCFWCCQCSMDKKGQSHCPLCRHPYHHFPAICWMLNLLLKKMYPISYDRRKTQTLEFEKQTSLGCSQDLDCHVISEELDQLSIAEQPSKSTSEEKKSINGSSSVNYNHVTVADMLCSSCKQLLYRPVALNCGHVYCEACITVSQDKVIKCQVCECNHPSGFPKVCKELDYFLQEHFASEYAHRKNTTQQIQNGNPLIGSSTDDIQGSKFSYPTEENFLQWWAVHGSKFHPGAGCDMCGMCPIIGDRYQCKDCKEKSGYDVCGDCHKTGLNLPGRFNQKHTPHHHLVLVKPAINRDVIYRLLSSQLAIVSRNRSNPVNETLEPASAPLDDDNNANDNDNDVVGSTEGQSRNEST